MKSEVRFIGPSFKLGVTIGLFLTIIIIFTAVYLTPLFIIGGSVVILLIVGFGLLKLYAGYQHLRIAKYEADEREFRRNILVINRTQRALTPKNHPIQIIEATPEQVKLLPEKAESIQPIDLLTSLENEQRVLIVGASNSGKTELLKWVASRRVNTSQVVIVDPHSFVGKWPYGQVVGIGRDYAEIDRTLQALVQLMQKRYEQIGRGEVMEGNHKKVCCIVDEWRAITGNLPKAGDCLKTLLTESRKASMSMFIASHSDRAKPLGLSGEFDLRDGFVIVRLSIQNGQRQATIDTGNGEQAALLPGPYTGNGQIIEPDYLDLEIQPSATEAAILTLHRQGESISAIAESVFGSKGGNQNQQVKDTLSKFDVA